MQFSIGGTTMGEHYASDYSLIMGLVDLIPVILFGVAGSIIIRELFSKLRKPFSVLLCSGVTLSLTAGVFKAIWKILLSLNICDFYPFNIMFMPTQSLGFVLMGIGLISLLWPRKEDKNEGVVKTNMFAIPLFIILAGEAGAAAVQKDGNVIFIAMLVIGEILIATSLCYLAVRNRCWASLPLFIVSFICLMVMGAMKPLSTRMNLTVTQANWVEQGINIVAQVTLLVGCILMMKKGFFAFKERQAKKEEVPAE